MKTWWIKHCSGCGKPVTGGERRGCCVLNPPPPRGEVGTGCQVRRGTSLKDRIVLPKNAVENHFMAWSHLSPRCDCASWFGQRGTSCSLWGVGSLLGKSGGPEGQTYGGHPPPTSHVYNISSVTHSALTSKYSFQTLPAKTKSVTWNKSKSVAKAG